MRADHNTPSAQDPRGLGGTLRGPEVDLTSSMALQQLGRDDPSASSTSSSFSKVHYGSDGKIVYHTLTECADGLDVRVQGETAERWLGFWQNQFPLRDGLETFVPQHPMVRHLAQLFPALRIVAVPWLFDVAVGAILQQRVSAFSAFADFRKITLRFGTPTAWGVAFPSARQLAAIPAFELQSLGVDVKRAQTLRALAKSELRRPLIQFEQVSALRAHLIAITGIGPWTTEMIAGFGKGCTDALPLGDLHLPALVSRALAREPSGSDSRMTELLEGYRGQRFRVVRLLWRGLFDAKTKHLLVARRR
jgi:3-methyladenine DNA glycosylase/8-oxoguanine DNA glycosylase